MNSLLSYLAECPPVALIGRWFTRAIGYIKARWRRFRTPKELRDADFDTWTSNMNKCASCFWIDPADPVRPSCEICGCLIELKTRWMSEKCPVDEWDNTIILRKRIAELGKSSRPSNQSHPSDDTHQKGATP